MRGNNKQIIADREQDKGYRLSMDDKGRVQVIFSDNTYWNPPPDLRVAIIDLLVYRSKLYDQPIRAYGF